ncbi:MAG: flavodoxin family protein, partial [Candidatus Adiutrix sp.]|nr:flavodoxin family protein [Candidatus Adiutrix sp.]
MPKVLAFSGSSTRGGNIEKALQAVLAATEADTEFIRLAELDMKQCLACVKCVPTNRCVHQDDLNQILEKIIAADAFIIGAYPSFASVNALTKTFMERNWPLRHNHRFTRGKVGAAVVGGASRQATLADYFEMYFQDYLQTSYQGTLVIDGVVPCLVCGFGETCDGSGLLRRYGPEAKITPDKFY